MTSPTKDKTSAEKSKEAREESDRARELRDQEVLVRTTPSPVTAVDGLGVERIITTTTGYTPPQVEPDKAEVERLERLNKRLEETKQERLDSLTGTPDKDSGASVAAAAIKAEGSSSTKAKTNAS